MTHPVRGLGLVAPLVLISCVAAVQEAPAQSSSTAAYVYVQVGGSAGAVYGYSASSAGQLSAIPGSPFKPGTQIVGGTRSQFFSLGKTLLHAYAVGSNGAIGAQLSQIPVLNYAGNACGGGAIVPTAVLDHSGQYVYVLLWGGGDGTCTAYQTYKVSGGGTFTFVGDTEVNVESEGGTTLPSILGNETFAYADSFSGHNSLPIGFQRESSGTLQYANVGANLPTLDGGIGDYTARHPDASPAGNYVVLQLHPYNSGNPQLASYTVDSAGGLSTTNTQSNMPTSTLEVADTAFSPDGKLFVVSGDNGPYSNSGIEIYNFNGASPLTLNRKVLTGTPIDRIAWDSSNHLYAISSSLNKLYVLTVTSTSVTQNSSQTITNPLSLVVVSQKANSCSAPSSNGINVCSPAENATVSSPVQVNAMATISGGVYRFELWNGGTKLLSEDNGIMDQTVTLAPGTYHLTFDARNSSGDHQYAYRDITVTGSSGGACTAPSSEGVNVCTPAENAAVTSPVQVNAAATVNGGIYRFSLWNGSTKLLSEDNSGTMDQTVSLAPGTYHLTFDARSSSGDHQYAYRDITVK